MDGRHYAANNNPSINGGNHNPPTNTNSNTNDGTNSNGSLKRNARTRYSPGPGPARQLQQQQQQQHNTHMNSPSSSDDLRGKRLRTGTPPGRYSHYGAPPAARGDGQPMSPPDERNGFRHVQCHQQDERSPPANTVFRPTNTTPPLAEGQGRMGLGESPRMFRPGGASGQQPSHGQQNALAGLGDYAQFGRNNTRDRERERDAHHHHQQQQHPQHHSQPPPQQAPQQPHQQQRERERDHQQQQQQNPQRPQSPSHLQSAQQQHQQLQQQLQHPQGPNYPPHQQQQYQQQKPPPPPPPQQPQGPQRTAQSLYQHNRSTSYTEPSQAGVHPDHQREHPNFPGPRAASTQPGSNREMGPPSPPRFASMSGRPFPPPISQQPQFPSNSPFQGGRELPALPPLPASRPNTSMSLSSILGNDPPARPDSIGQHSAHHHRRDSLTGGQIRPDFAPAPIRRSYTPDYPAVGPNSNNDRNRPPYDDKSPSSSYGGASLPSLGKSNSQEGHPLDYRSGPSPRMQPSSVPPRPLSQPSKLRSSPHQSQQPPPAREQERDAHPFLQYRNPSHSRADSYPEPYYIQQMQQQAAKRDQLANQSKQNPSFPSSATSQPSQQQTSPAYHHPPPTTNSTPSIPFSAYTTPMPPSPFAITPSLPNQHSLPVLPQFDGVDRRRQNLNEASPTSAVGREVTERHREPEGPPLRAEDALVRGVQERRVHAADAIMAQLIADRKRVNHDEGEPGNKRDGEDVEMSGLNRSEAGSERSNKKRKSHHHHHTTGHHHHHHNTHQFVSSFRFSPVRAKSSSHHHHHHPPIKTENGSAPEDLLAVSQPPSALLLNRSSPGPMQAQTPQTQPRQAPQQQPIPALPPRLVVNNTPVLEMLKEFPRSHLGSMIYKPVNYDPITKRVENTSTIPYFPERENCTYDVRISAHDLSIAERSKVCEKRMLWGTGVYTDDSNILAILIHEGHIPVVQNGVESMEYESAHDVAAAQLLAQPQPKKSRASAKQKELNALAVQNAIGDGPPPMPSSPVRLGCDLVVTLVIAPTLEKYASQVRYGLKSREWSTEHEGMSLLIEEVVWVPVVMKVAEERGIGARNRRLKDQVEQKKRMLGLDRHTTKKAVPRLVEVESAWPVAQESSLRETLLMPVSITAAG